LETDGNHSVLGQEIWWVMHFFKYGFKYSSLSNMLPVSRCIVVQK